MKIEIRKLTSIKPYEKNPRVNDAAVDAVARSIQEFGFRQPVVVDAEGVIICGHTRWKAAQKLGLKTVPVHVAKDLTPEKIRAYRIADNKTRDLSEWDEGLLIEELRGLADVDWTALGFTEAELDALLHASEPGADVQHVSLADRFIVPPFSVLDARQGYWQARKSAWLALGIQSELGRGGGLTMSAEQVTTEHLNYYRNRQPQAAAPGRPVTIPKSNGATGKEGQ